MESIRIASTRTFDESVRLELLGKLKANLRITSTDLDDLLGQLLCAAIEDSERYIGAIIVPSEFTYSDRIDEDPTSSLLPLDLLGPVSPDGKPSVTLGGEVVEATLSGRQLAITAKTSGKLVVRWRAGMESIPENIVHAIILKASYLFDNPSDTVKERVTASDALLRPYRTFSRH